MRRDKIFERREQTSWTSASLRTGPNIFRTHPHLYQHPKWLWIINQTSLSGIVLPVRGCGWIKNSVGVGYMYILSVGWRKVGGWERVCVCVCAVAVVVFWSWTCDGWYSVPIAMGYKQQPWWNSHTHTPLFCKECSFILCYYLLPWCCQSWYC